MKYLSEKKNIIYFSAELKRTPLSKSETKPEEGESPVNQVLDGNALDMSRKKTTVFTENCQMTDIVEKEELKVLSIPAASLSIENETSGKFF